MDFNKVVEKRRSVREFLIKTPNWRKIIRAIDVARHSPAAGNLAVVRYIIVDKEKTIRDLTEACQQEFFKDVKAVVVVISEPKELKRHYGENSERYAHQQAGSAIANFLLAIVNEGLASCWVGHFYENKIKRLLTIPDECSVEAVLPIGYESKRGNHKKVIKPDLDQIMFFNAYGGGKNKRKTYLKVVRNDWA